MFEECIYVNNKLLPQFQYCDMVCFFSSIDNILKIQNKLKKIVHLIIKWVWEMSQDKLLHEIP